MDKLMLHGSLGTEVCQSFISKLHCSISKGLPHAEPVLSFQTDEPELVRGVLHMIQGFSNSMFFWDGERQCFLRKSGIYVSHLSQTSLNSILNQFVSIGTCFKRVESFIDRVMGFQRRAPTLEAFAYSVSLWLKRLRDLALKVEEKSVGSDRMTTTLQGLTDTLSRLRSGSECLLKVVYGAVPGAYFDTGTSIPGSEMAAHILDHLFKKLNEVCLVKDGEDESYHMVLAIFSGSLLPYLKGLDAWLYDGILDDPYEEMFFFANSSVAIDQPAFWERSYLFRTCKWSQSRSTVSLTSTIEEKTMSVGRGVSNHEQPPISSSAKGQDHMDVDIVMCPSFLKEMAKGIVSAGKSLQLVRHAKDDHRLSSNRSCHNLLSDLGTMKCQFTDHKDEIGGGAGSLRSFEFANGWDHYDHSRKENAAQFSHENSHVLGELSLSDVFLLSLSHLIFRDTCISYNFGASHCENSTLSEAFVDEVNRMKVISKDTSTSNNCELLLHKFHTGIVREMCSCCVKMDTDRLVETEELGAADRSDPMGAYVPGASLGRAFCPENPVVTVCREFLDMYTASWNDLNISQSFHLAPLNDEKLREAIFGGRCANVSGDLDVVNRRMLPRLCGTDYTFGFQSGEFGQFLENETKNLMTLFPFPTLLPCFEEELPITELLPFQKNSTLSSRVLSLIQKIKPKEAPLPSIILQECLSVFIKKKVDNVGRSILSKLMSDWNLMDELSVLRAIYLLGSGDLLQQFLLVIFDRLNKGDSWDDDFELNTILQESIRNSAEGSLVNAPDSLVVSVVQNSSSDNDHATSNLSTPRKVRTFCFGVDALDLLKFTYKVSWPLDLIANAEAINKYNQVMRFLLKVKRAKYALDKARRLMWKGKIGVTPNYKRHLLVEQKLLHFVDALHQYVMDRVLHSAWVELCSGMASAGSLDEVIEVHEAYLLSVQRQCFVAPDKVWALIASRIKSILGLALDFYSIQQTLSTGGAGPAIKARFEMQIDRIEKQFNDCIAFLLRILSFKLNVGHFPHLADMVTRINYNYFYMSESGNLLTVPSFETAAAKLGKTSTSRTD